MSKLVIVVDFQDEDELTEKLEGVRQELSDDIFDRATQLPSGLLWQGDDYNLYLLGNGSKLTIATGGVNHE